MVLWTAALFDEPPPPTGDVRVDAALAALAEHLARHDGFTTASDGLNLVESVYPGRPIPPKVQFLLEEYFDR